MFHGHLDYFQKPPLGGRPNTKPGDHGTPNAHNRSFILLYHKWGPAQIEFHWHSTWLRAQSHITSTLHLRNRNHTTWFWRCDGTAFGHFLSGSHNFMVFALGSCVKSEDQCYFQQNYMQFLNDIQNYERASWVTRKKLVHYNPPLRLGIATHARKMHKKNLCGCPLGGFG